MTSPFGQETAKGRIRMVERGQRGLDKYLDPGVLEDRTG